jgi:hypothetical protein
MKQSRFLLNCAVWLLALLTVNPSLPATKKKQTVARKEHPAQQKDEHSQEKTEQEVKDLRTDVYSRATWAALQKVKQEADDTAGTVRLVTLIGAGIGFLVGCVVTWLVAKRMGKSDDALKIT